MVRQVGVAQTKLDPTNQIVFRLSETLDHANLLVPPKDYLLETPVFLL